MFCPRCTTYIPDDEDSCGRCGMPVASFRRAAEAKSSARAFNVLSMAGLNYSPNYERHTVAERYADVLRGPGAYGDVLADMELAEDWHAEAKFYAEYLAAGLDSRELGKAFPCPAFASGLVVARELRDVTDTPDVLNRLYLELYGDTMLKMDVMRYVEGTATFMAAGFIAATMLRKNHKWIIYKKKLDIARNYTSLIESKSSKDEEERRIYIDTADRHWQETEKEYSLDLRDFLSEYRCSIASLDIAKLPDDINTVASRYCSWPLRLLDRIVDNARAIHGRGLLEGFSAREDQERDIQNRTGMAMIEFCYRFIREINELEDADRDIRTRMRAIERADGGGNQGSPGEREALARGLTHDWDALHERYNALTDGFLRDAPLLIEGMARVAREYLGQGIVRILRALAQAGEEIRPLSWYLRERLSASPAGA